MTDRDSLPWWIGAGTVATAAGLFGAWQRAEGPTAVPALGALALMTVYLLNWLICLLLAASYDLRPLVSRQISARIVCGAATVGVLGLLLCSCEWYQPAAICGAPATLIGVFGFSGENGAIPARHRSRVRAGLLAVGLVLFVLVVLSEDCLSTSTWLMFGIMALAAFTLSATARSDRPAMVYPASAIFGYVGFAIFYNGLPENQQALLPAGASVIVLFGLTASVYMVIKFSHPKRAILGCLGVFAVLFAINGNAWQVDPNHFKLQFPNLEAYYNNRLDTGNRGDDEGEPSAEIYPTWLDTRAYVRSTVSSVVKLRHTDLVQQQNLQFNQGNNEKLGSVGYEIILLDGCKDVLLGINDKHGRFRAAPGDPIHLILPDRPFSVTVEDEATIWGLRELDAAKNPQDPGDANPRVPDDSACERSLLKGLVSGSDEIRVWFDPTEGRGVGLHYLQVSRGSKGPVRGLRQYRLIDGEDPIAMELYGMASKAIPRTVSVAPIFKGRVIDRLEFGVLPKKYGADFDALVQLEGSSNIKEIIVSSPTSSPGSAPASGEAPKKPIGESVFQHLIEESHVVLERPAYKLDQSQPVSGASLRAAEAEFVPAPVTASRSRIGQGDGLWSWGRTPTPPRNRPAIVW